MKTFASAKKIGAVLLTLILVLGMIPISVSAAQIFVVMQGGNSISVEIEPSDTVGEVKQKIEAKAGIPTDLQQLSFGERTLEDARTLADYNITNNSSVQLAAISVSYLNPGGNVQTVSDFGFVVNSVTAFEDDAWYVVSGDVTVSGIITVSGSANLILLDDCVLKAEAGINVTEGNALTIHAGSFGEDVTGSGELNATGGTYHAGIGGNYSENSGAVTINGGTVKATGGEGAAGIGGGFYGNGSDITINGGTVTAKGSDGAAGIGGGHGGNGEYITIYGGTVNAKCEFGGAGIGGGACGCASHIEIGGGTVIANGGNNAAGIGGGDGRNGSNITIYGGTVTADGGNLASGIGGGDGGKGEHITINGGTVTANGGNLASGIGGGSGGNGEYITINGGTVTATGAVTATGTNGGAGIGGGDCGSGAEFIIRDGNITATGGAGAAGIGGGYSGSAWNITIEGGTVTANGGNSGAGIGGGNWGDGNNIEISGGTVTANGGDGAMGIGGGKDSYESSVTVTGEDKYVTYNSDDESALKDNEVPPAERGGMSGGTKRYFLMEKFVGSLSVSPSSLDFGTVKLGYTDLPAAQTVTVTNNGDKTTEIALPACEGYSVTEGDGFVSGLATLASGGSASFTVQPKSGLTGDAQNATLTVSGKFDESADVALLLTVHVHNWTYSASGNVIYADCVCGEEYTLTLNYGSFIYDGNAHIVNYTNNITPVTGEEVDSDATIVTFTRVGNDTAFVTLGGVTAYAPVNVSYPDDEIVIRTVGGTKVYDGTPLSGTVSAGVLPAGFNYDRASTEAQVTHVSEGDVNVLADHLIIRDTDGNDATSELNLTIIEEATIKIMPAELTVTTGSAEKTYDGTPLTNSDVTVEGLATGESVTVTATGSRTSAGSSENAFTLVFDNAQETDYVVTNGAGLLKINKKTPAAADFTVTVPADCDYDGNAHAAMVSLAPPYTGCSFAVVYKNQSGTLCDSAIDAGTYTVCIKVLDTSENFEAGTVETNETFTISKATGSVTAPAAKILTYTGSPLELVEAGSSQTGAMQYKLEGGSYNAAVPKATDAGEYTVYYKSAGDKNHNDTAEGSVKVTIAKAEGEIAAPTARELTYTGEPTALLIAGISPTGAVHYKLGEDGTYSTSIPNGTDAGEYTVYYKSVGDKNHLDTAEGSVKVTIAKAEGEVTAPTAKELTYTGEPLELVDAGISETGTLLYRLGEDGDFAEEIPAATDAGEYAVYYKSVGDKNHLDTAEGSVTVTVAKAIPEEEKDYALPAELTCYEGKTLADVELPEGFSWVEDIGTAVDKVGENVFHVKYTPADGDNYETLESIEVILTVEKRPAPVITAGANQTIDVNDGKDAAFVSDAPFEEFLKVTVDGKDVDPKYYTASEGSTVVTLTKAFLATLSNGKHTLAIVSKYGSAETTFTITGQKTETSTPKTGDAVFLWSGFLFVGCCAVIGTVLCDRKKRRRAK